MLALRSHRDLLLGYSEHFVSGSNFTVKFVWQPNFIHCQIENGQMFGKICLLSSIVQAIMTHNVFAQTHFKMKM
jgi:hypothetical protein